MILEDLRKRQRVMIRRLFQYNQSRVPIWYSLRGFLISWCKELQIIRRRQNQTSKVKAISNNRLNLKEAPLQNRRTICQLYRVLRTQQGRSPQGAGLAIFKISNRANRITRGIFQMLLQILSATNNNSSISKPLRLIAILKAFLKRMVADPLWKMKEKALMALFFRPIQIASYQREWAEIRSSNKTPQQHWANQGTRRMPKAQGLILAQRAPPIRPH